MAADPRPRATVLIVEDDPGIAELEKDRLEEAGYRTRVAATAEDAIRELGRNDVDLILLDYRLPGGVDGLDFYARVKVAGYDLPVILVTGHSSEATIIQALRVGVRDFVTKSVEYLDYLPDAVGRVLRQVDTEHQLAGIIASAKDAIITTDRDRRVTLFNPVAERMFGCTATEAVDRPVTDFITDELGPPPGGTGDPPPPVVLARLELPRDQPAVGGHLLAGPEPLRVVEVRHHRFGRPRPQAGHRVQQPNPGTRLPKRVQLGLGRGGQPVRLAVGGQGQVDQPPPQLVGAAVGQRAGELGDPGQSGGRPGPGAPRGRQPLAQEDGADAVLGGHSPTLPTISSTPD